MQEYLKESGVPHACLLTSIFFENFLEGMGPRKQEDGSAAFSTNLGTAPHAWHSVIDIGGSAAGLHIIGCTPSAQLSRNSVACTS